MTAEPIRTHEHAPGDRDLIRRIQGGEIDRFADLMDRHQLHVTRIVGRRVPADRVDEVVHDVFVRAYFGLAQFSDSVSFDHWLAGIAVRTCYDFWRARKREELPVSTLTKDHHQWIDQVLSARSDEEFSKQAKRREATEVLEWALGRLSPENRSVLTLVHLEGYSVREAAQMLGWTVVTVKVRAHRARHALRRIIEDNQRGIHDTTSS